MDEDVPLVLPLPLLDALSSETYSTIASSLPSLRIPCGRRNPLASSPSWPRLGDLDLTESRRPRRGVSGEDPLVCATASSALAATTTMAISLEDSEMDSSKVESNLRVVVASEVDDAIAGNP